MLSLCTLSLSTQLFNQQPYRIQKSACDWVLPLITPLVKTSTQGSATSFNYTASIETSIDTYASLWNFRTLVAAGRGGSQVIPFVTSLFAEGSDQSINWANRDGVAMQLLLESGPLPKKLDIIGQIETDIETHIQNGVASQLDVRTVAMSYLLAELPLPSAITSALEIEGLAFDLHASVFDNTDSMFIAQGVGAKAILETFPKDYLNKVANSILVDEPSGIYTSIFYSIMRRSPELYKSHSHKISTYVNQLKTGNGGFSLQPGADFEPQVTFNATALGASASEVVNSKNYSEMKYPKYWIKRMGKFSAGTSILAGVLLKRCTNKPIISNTDDGDAGLQKCLSQNFGDFNLVDLTNSNSQTLVERARKKVLAKICGLPNWKASNSEFNAQTGSASNMRENLAQKVMSNNSEWSFETQTAHSLKVKNGCRYSENNFSQDADLFSSSICLANGGLNRAESAASLSFFGEQVGKAALSSPETILWFAVMLNGESDLGELLVMN